MPSSATSAISSRSSTSTDDQVTQLEAIAQSLRDQNAQYRRSTPTAGMQQVAQTLIKDPSNVAAPSHLDGQSTAENAMKKNALNAASKALQVLRRSAAKLGVRWPPGRPTRRVTVADCSANVRRYARPAFAARIVFLCLWRSRSNV